MTLITFLPHTHFKKKNVLIFLIGIVISLGKGITFLFVSKEIHFFPVPIEMTVPIKKVRTFFFLKGVCGRQVISVICQAKPSFTHFL